MPVRDSDVRFSNRPVGVKRIQTVHGSMKNDPLLTSGLDGF